MTTRRPGVLAPAAVRLAAAALPAAVRARYRAEWLAELHHLAPAARLRHAAGVLSRVPALWIALEEDVMTRSGPLWRCRVLRWHEFVRRSTPDGGLYQECRRCGLDRGPTGAGPMTTPPYPVGSAGA